MPNATHDSARPPDPRGRGALQVLLADDHRITLWGLQRLIESPGSGMRVTGAVTTRGELLAHPALADADVILLDLDLGGCNGADAIPDLARRSPAQVLILTAAEDPEVYRDAVVKGARGVLHKSADADTLLRAIAKVAAGEIWLDAKVLGQVMARLTGREPPHGPADPEAADIASLTAREREVVATMVRLPGSKQLVVADALGLSEHTLRNHLTTIYDKLKVHGRLELYVLARRHGFEPPGEEPA